MKLSIVKHNYYPHATDWIRCSNFTAFIENNGGTALGLIWVQLNDLGEAYIIVFLSSISIHKILYHD